MTSLTVVSFLNTFNYYHITVHFAGMRLFQRSRHSLIIIIITIIIFCDRFSWFRPRALTEMLSVHVLAKQSKTGRMT